jgi:hypothetical protein
MGFFSKLIILILLITVGSLAGWSTWQKYSHEKETLALQQRLAQSAETIKIQEGQYQKLVEVQKGLQASIDKSNEQGRELAERLDKVNAKLLVVSNAQVKVKDQLVKIEDAVNTKRPDGGWEFRVDKNEGLLGVNGLCWTGPTADNKSGCELKLKLEPFTLTQVVSQQPDGSWKVDAAVPPQVEIRFGEVSVNPYILRPNWYQKFNFTLQVGSTTGVQEGLVGFGAGYKVRNFNISGLTHFSSAGDSHGYLSLSLTWFPWEK